MTDGFRLQVLEDALRTVVEQTEAYEGVDVTIDHLHDVASHALDAVTAGPDGVPLGVYLDRSNALGRALEPF